MKNSSIATYLLIIGLLLVLSIGWYIFAFLTQPIETAQDTPAPVSTRPVLLLTLTITPAKPILSPSPTIVAVSFDGQRAYTDVETQVAFGPRIPGSDGHANVQEWMREELESAGWQVKIQETEAMGHPIHNLIANRGGTPPQIILGAHYDTRIYADNDSILDNHTLPVPGANDGASGVAVLLELARVLPEDTVPLWLVFFDAEDNGRIEGWDWILGSHEFVKNNLIQPRAVVILDMIGDADLNIYKEYNSSPELMDEIWNIAVGLGYESKFIEEYKHSMIDDHRPFLNAGIPAIDIIDFDYPYWHTLQDTPDKVSAESLQAVGETLQNWVMGQSSQP